MEIVIPETFWRTSARSPLESPTSMTDMKIHGAGSFVLADLGYWRFTNAARISSVGKGGLLADINAKKRAEELFDFDFHFCDVRKLCYAGVAARGNPFALYGLVNEYGACLTTYERDDVPDDKEFFVWHFEGDLIAPLPEGDGWIVKPTKILNKETGLDFYRDMSCYDYKDHLWYKQQDADSVLEEMLKRYGTIWKDRNSPQYDAFIERKRATK